MLKIEKDKKTLVPISQFQPGPLPSIEEFQQLLVNSAKEFFSEFGEDLFLVEADSWPAEAGQVRPDLLSIDKQGCTVAIILPHGTEQSQMARAIASLGILSRWKPEEILRGCGDPEKAELEAFLSSGLQGVNRQQRAILIAGEHDVTVLAAVKWLQAQSGLEIRCVRVGLSVDSRGSEFLTCSDASSVELPVYQLLRPEVADSAPKMKGTPRVLPGGVDRRRQLRTLKYDSHHLRLGSGQGESPVVQLIDLTEKGLGVETRDPLTVGSYVTVAGDLHGAESAVKLEGRARVAHCRQHNGSFRVGLFFEEIRCQDLY